VWDFFDSDICPSNEWANISDFARAAARELLRLTRNDRCRMRTGDIYMLKRVFR
jgi:hypothetical protein